MNIPAFPLEMVYSQETEKFNGMTLRDYFAAKALPEVMKQWTTADLEGWSEIAYELADAMLKARSE